MKPFRQEKQEAVIPAEAGFSTAELVIHLDLALRAKMDSRFRGNDGNKWRRRKMKARTNV
jgi:hypothetical protein